MWNRRRALFANRREAGRRLAERLRGLDGGIVVLGLPRGGVPVAEEVADVLGSPLDVIIVRKLGVPSQPELGMGAIGEGGALVVNADVVRLAGVTPAELDAVQARERVELERRARRFRGDRAGIDLADRTAVIVDDGIATGSTAKAACRVARALGARRIVLAVPVAPEDWVERIGADADECIALATPEPFYAVGEFYEDFDQTTDDEVVACLARAVSRPRSSAGGGPRDRGDGSMGCDEEVSIPAGQARLGGHLVVPPTGPREPAPAIVLFAHGSGSGRHSPRNRYVASVLQEAGLATLLFDLLTPEEALDRSKVLDIELLARRLTTATAWVRGRHRLDAAPIGFFGASTGAAAALWAAAEPGLGVGAVVSRGGRPDLAEARLGRVTAPTLLIVGGDDDAVVDLNRHARSLLRCPSELRVIPGASHLFEEPGTLEAAAAVARDWFLAHLGPA